MAAPFLGAARYRACASRRACIRSSSLIMQDYIGQQFCPDGQMPVVFDQTHSSEFVHEVTDARPSRAYHFGQGLVTQGGYFGVRLDVVFAQARELQENPSEPLFAVVEKLIAEVFFKI